jgi:hypothetical protein
LKRKFRGVCVQQNWLQGVRVLQLNEKVSVVTKTDYTNLSNFSSNSPFQTHLIYLNSLLTLSDPTSNLVRQYDFPVPLRCRKTPDTVFVAFVRPLSEPVRRFSSCSTDFSQQIAQVVLFLYLHVFLF